MTDDKVIDGLTIDGLLRRAARLWPERTAYVHDDLRLTWAELAVEADRHARALMAWGLQPGDRVSVWMGNTLDWILVELGIIRAGGVVVPVNTGFTVSEAAFVVGQSDSVMLITTGSLRGRDLAAESVAVATHDGVAVRSVVTTGPAVPGAMGLDELLAHADEVSREEADDRSSGIAADDIVLTLYTSGTTGFPKGVMHSHRIIGNMTDAADRIQLTPDDRAVMYLPLFHIFALAATVTFMSRGATMILLEVFEGGASLDLMEREQVTLVYGVAPHYLDQIRHPSYDQRDLSSIRLCLSPGTADLVRLVSERMGPAVNVYGMTETTSMTSLGSIDEPLELRAASVGRPLPRSRIRVVDERGVDVAPGVVGHLLVKGPPVMQGYYKLPEVTGEAIVDGWFRTGDALTIDEAGYLRFAGRITEMFKVGGENVDPIEVEETLMRHPAVAFASVQGIPDERLGEVGLAHVTLIDGEGLKGDELRQFARERLAAFKVPRHVEVVDQMPMTASGKVRKFLLREAFLADRP
ncbi:class I adenylate-forming enzyme family protein [Aeromicrobium sp. P5_D10]